MDIDLYARTELDEFSKKDIISTSSHFILIRRGWFSYSFLLPAPYTTPRPYLLAKAMQIVDAMTTLEE